MQFDPLIRVSTALVTPATLAVVGLGSYVVNITSGCNDCPAAAAAAIAAEQSTWLCRIHRPA